MRKILCVFLALSMAFAGALLFSDSAKLDSKAPSWAAWRGPNGNGISTDARFDAKLLSAAKTLWTVNVGEGYSAASVYGGFVYTVGKSADSKETLRCMDYATGKTKWTYSYPSDSIDYPGSRTTPVISDGKVYVLSLTGYACCVDASSGAKIWERDIARETKANRPDWGFASSALIEGTMAYFNVGESGCALDKNSGKILWKSGTAASGYSTPVGFTWQKTRYLALMGSKSFIVVNAATGKVQGRVEWETEYDVNAADPLVFDDKIFITSGYGHGGACFQMGDKGLTLLWETYDVSAHFPSAVYLNGYIYASNTAAPGFGELVCINPKDGEVKWAEDIGNHSFIVVNNVLLAVSEIGTLIAINPSPDGYKELGRLDDAISRLCWTAPTIAGGRVFLRADNGDISCLNVGK